ncbi:soluble scavenger receptor cysteine-rich domain-containing protein SSC5D isoform X3 [Cervus elaphus]|uniref:soluble scavenger receptor cysteine-rich domain-containing protein SSC5D isoform X3 n=1 Tax=Cervus elaphus TaxID=9860 RepID=UPI001CC2BBDB|nr:soluble scavenger receptor cysteine-rich domain-containing protein SSC5D isoform X3 [Cervus elaphus]
MRVLACLLVTLMGTQAVGKRLRLADGPHGCAGRLEVWHGGRWGTVCDDGWDLRDAAVACRELGCGGALAAPGGAFFGEGAGPILLDDLRCRGNETALRFCPARPWGQHDCHHREDAGAVCDGMPLGYAPPTAPAAGSNSSGPRGAASRPPPPTASQAQGTPGVSALPALPTALQEPGPDAGSPQLRLVAGPSRCSGRLEVWHAGRWGTVCDDGWDLRDAAVVCRELGCGGPRQPDPTAGRFGWGAGPIWLDDVRCAGTEAALADCPAAPWGKHNCAHNEDVGVTCAGTPGLDSISDPFSWSWIPSLGRDPDAWLPGELATKPSARRTSSVPEKTTTKAPGKMPKSTKKWVTKNAKRPTTQPLAMPTTKHSRVPGTQSPPELTSRTTTTSTPAMGASRRPTSEFTTRLTTEAPHRLTSHTTVTRTSRAPRERTSKTVGTPTTQGPLLVTSEATVEPSAELPGQGSPESSTDPAPSPTSAAAGPFRVRLADGPNRCAGRLEVWHAGRWGTVCDDGWDLRDGMVACWELGCGRIRPRVGKTHYGPGTGPIWLDDVGCKGSESSLSDCPARAWGQHNCDHEEDVGLTCTGYADEEDYPPWTWDPTSGEDLAKGTTAAGVPGHTLSRETTGSSGAPAPATRRLPSTGDKDCREPSQTGDTPSGGVPAKETPTAATPGPPGTTRSSGHPSLAPRLRGDTGSPRRPWPERRLRPTTARTAPAAPSPASSDAPGSAGPPLTSASAPLLTRTAASTPEATPDAPSAVPPSPAAASRGSIHRTSTSPSLTGPSPDAAAAPAPTSGLSPTPPPTAPKELTSDPSAPAAATRLSPTSGLTPELDRAPGRGMSPQPSAVPEPSSSPDRSTGPHPTTAPYSTVTSHPTTAPYSTMTSHPAATSHPTTAPYSSMISHPAVTSHPTTAPYFTMTSHPAATSHPTTTLYPTTTPRATTSPHPTTIPYPTTTPHPTVTSHPTTALYPTTTPHATTTPYPTTTPQSISTPHATTTPYPTTTPQSTSTPHGTMTPYPTTTPQSTSTPHGTMTPYPTTTPQSTSTPHATMTPYPTTTPQSTSTPHPVTTPAPITTAQSTTTPHPDTTFHPIMTPHPATTPHAATTPHPTTTAHPITTPYPATSPHLTTTAYRAMTPDLTSAPVVTAKSVLTSLETEPLSPSPVKPSLHPQLNFTGPHHPSTSPASESSLSPAPSMDILSTENFKPATSQSPQVTSPPTQTPHSAPDPTVTPVGSSGDHLTPMAHPLDQPPPDHLSLGPAPSPSSGPLGPCEVPVPPVRVMACEPPALVELVAAVRDVGSQLQRLNQALERDQQERRALGLGLTQLVEAAQGLGQLGEFVKRLAEVAWPPTTPVPTTTTPEWEERPLRGDV